MSTPTPPSKLASHETFKSTKKSALNPTTKKLITVMLIGEAGSGKTSFMSLLVNLFQGNDPFELVDKHDPKQESGLTVSKTQTTKATLYTVKTLDGTQIRILDTPGLADTDGVDRDNEHLQNIDSAIGTYNLAQIDGVLILANGRNGRLNVLTEYTLRIIAARFPHTVTENISFIFTSCSLSTVNFKMDMVQEELRKSRHWYIDNPLAILKNLQREQAKRKLSPREHRQFVSNITNAYEDAVEDMNDWLEWLDERKPQETKAIRKLSETAVCIDSRISTIMSNFDVSRIERQELEKARAGLDRSKAAIEQWERLQREHTRPRWQLEPTARLNTVCNAPGCHTNCHISCMTAGKSKPIHCLRFSKGQGQTVCDSCGHRASEHQQIYDVHVQRAQAADPETTRRLDSARTEAQRHRTDFESLTKKIDELTKKTTATLVEMHKLVDEFNGLSLSKNFAGHINSAIDLLKARKEKLIMEPNTEKDREMIDSALEKLRKKLATIRGDDLSN